MKKEKRFSLALRLVGALCTLLLIGSAIYIAVVGISIAPSVLATLALAGLVGPCVSAGESVLEVLTAIVELVAEGIATLVDAVLNAIGSLFG